MADAIDGVLSVGRLRHGSEPRLDVVLESGHKNAGDVIRLYDFSKSG
jgi:hypothetical protein